MSKLTNCRDCGHAVSKNADACPNCGAKVKRTSVLTWIAAIFIGLMVLSAVMSGFSDDTSNSNAAVNEESPDAIQVIPTSSENNSNEDVASEAEATTSKWQYDESVDEMRGQSSYFAINKSNNVVDLGFPYGQDVDLNIIIRDDAEYGKDVLFAVNKGQLFCSYQDCYVSVKFDDGPVQKLVANEAEAGSSEVLFLANDISSFVNKLKKSDSVMIEVNFFDHGKEQFKFDVSGLDWSGF